MAAGLLAAVVAVLPVEARNRVASLAGITSEQSGSFRLGVWRDTLRLVSSSPWLGSGFGAFQDALPRFKTAAGHLAVEHAESDHLELLAEGGLMGGGLAGTLAGLVLASGLRAASDARERLPRGIASGALAGFAATLVHGAFDFNLHIPSNALLAAALLAIVLAVASDRRPRAARMLITGALAVTLAAALVTPWTAQRLEAGSLSRAAHSGAASLRRADLEADVVSQIRSRAADAPAWLALAWLRLPTSRSEASSLANWAVTLDPASEAIRTAQAELNSSR